jgi:hypothetical protein
MCLHRWPLAILLSRSFNLSPEAAGPATALVPFGDLLNHDPRAACFLQWDAALDAVVMRPDRPYRRGEQARPFSVDDDGLQSQCQGECRAVLTCFCRRGQLALRGTSCITAIAACPAVVMTTSTSVRFCKPWNLPHLPTSYSGD